MRFKKESEIIQDIDQEEGRCLLQKGAETIGVDLTTFQLDQFMSFLNLLDTWNRHINLTGLRSWREIIGKHFLDSLTPLPYLPAAARILDLGSGAGFPGIPIKIARPVQSVTLIEASTKKVSFLKEAVRYLKLGPIPIYQSYLGKGPSPLLEEGPFEIVVTRAVGKTINLLTAADPYLKIGGKILFMKGPKGSEEIFKQRARILDRGFQIETPIVLTLPLLEQERILIFITKVGKLDSR
jgi:16S rRNA (guanine527-N7)-methyltransferase